MELHFDAVGAQGAKRYFDGLTRETLAHAYLFSGPAGVGKKFFARRLAQSLLCLAPKDGILGYDGVCSSCTLFARTAHTIPISWNTKERSRSATPMRREVFTRARNSRHGSVRQLSLQSYSGGMRVLLLGDVDFATREAANALLKFLEEPPKGVVMLLTTPAPGRLLPTIRSRALEVRFPSLSNAQVGEVLGRMHYGDDDAELGASLGGGSVTRAVAALGGEEESLRAHVARWFFESVEGASPQDAWATRETLDDGLETIKTLVRDWIVASGHDGVALVSLDFADRLRRLRPLKGREAVALLGKLDEAQRLARTNVSAALVGELVRMSLAAMTYV